MLVLTRHVGESIDIGTDIRITIVRIGDTQVRVGITAPQSLNIARTELIEKPESGQ